MITVQIDEETIVREATKTVMHSVSNEAFNMCMDEVAQKINELCKSMEFMPLVEKSVESHIETIIENYVRNGFERLVYGTYFNAEEYINECCERAVKTALRKKVDNAVALYLKEKAKAVVDSYFKEEK